MNESELRLPKKPEVILIDPLKPFLFDPDKQEFVVGEGPTLTKIKLSDTEGISSITRMSGDNFSENVRLDTSEMMFLSSSDVLIQMPPLRKWLVSLRGSEIEHVRRKTAEAIRDTYNEKVKEKRLRNRSKKINDSILGFKASIFNSGTFVLNTLGEYAALGFDDPLHCHAIYYWNLSRENVLKDLSFPVEYYLHNADRDNGEAKRLSLYAGAGTIAWLAKNYKNL